MKTCLECLSLDLKAYPRHSAVGYGHCKNTPTGAFNSFNHPICEKFKQAPEEIVAKRVAFDRSL